jgi:hypothetical protein
MLCGASATAVSGLRHFPVISGDEISDSEKDCEQKLFEKIHVPAPWELNGGYYPFLIPRKAGGIELSGGLS